MAFVYDGETLPAGKSDLAPSTVPVDKKITAAEYNALISAVTDLRTALLSGQYHGLSSNLAAVSPADGVRLRSRAGVLEVSQDGDRYRHLEVEYRPEDYGAVGDGATDDGQALDDCLAAATAAHGRMVLRAGRTYMTGRELLTSTTTMVAIVGRPGVAGTGHASTIKAMPGSGLRAVLTVRTPGVVLEHLRVDANGTALAALYLTGGASLCQFRGVSVVNALWDGELVAGEADTPHHSSLGLADARWVRRAALALRSADLTTHAGSTCATTAGSATLTFTGGPDLTTLGLTAGGAYPAAVHVRWSGGIYIGHVEALSAGAITLRTTGLDAPPTFTETGLAWVAHNFVPSICDTNSHHDFSSGACGTLLASTDALAEYTTGLPRRTSYADTAAVTSGGYEVTLSGGAADLVAGMVRPGDMCCVGAAAQRHMATVMDVRPDGKTFTVDRAFPYSASGLRWAVGVGWGYRECQNADANIHSFSGTGLHRFNAGGGLAFSGFYGPKLDGGQIDYCGMVALRLGGPGTTLIGAQINRVYTESCGPNGWQQQIYLHAAQGVVITAPLDATGIASTSVLADSASWGTYTGRYEIAPVGVSGGIVSSVPCSALSSPSLTGVAPWARQHLNNTGWSAAGTNTLTANLVTLDPTGGSVVFSGAPTLSAPKVGVYVLACAFGQPNSVTFQDEVSAGGTRLRLRSPRVCLEQGETLTLLWDGLWWWELARGTAHGYPYADTSGTPGNATVTAPKGRAAVASGASTITITTPRVFGTGLYGVGVSQVDIMWEDDPGGHHRVTIPSGGGSFTVTLPAAVGADTKFRWRIED